jgi:transposase
MLEALLRGQAKPEEIAQFAKGRAKKKISEMIAALEGHQMSDHHRRMIRYSVDHMRFLEEQIAQLDKEIAARIREAGLEPQWQLLQSVPGVQETSAADSGGNRNGHDAVSLGEAQQLVGRNLSGQQSECRKKSK